MKSLTLPYFGQLEADKLLPLYKASMAFSGFEVSLELHFDTNSNEQEVFDRIYNFLNNIAQLDQLNKSYIYENYHDETAELGVRDYIQYHLLEIEQEKLAPILQLQHPTIPLYKQLLEKLHLVSISIHFENEYLSVVFEYALGSDISKELVVINTDEFGDLDYISWES